MKNKQLYSIVGLVSIALLGILLLQVYWIWQMAKLHEARFQANVYKALNQVVRQLEVNEAKTATTQYIKTGTRTPMNTEEEEIIVHTSVSTDTCQSSIGDMHEFHKQLQKVIHTDSAKGRIIRQERIVHESYQLGSKEGKISVESSWAFADSLVKETKSKGTQILMLQNRGVDTENVELNVDVRMLNGGKEDSLKGMIVEIVQAMKERSNTEERKDWLNVDRIDSLLTSELANQGIEHSYVFSILSEKNEQALLTKGTNDPTSTEYRVKLFPNAVFFGQDFLSLRFPNEHLLLLGDIALPATASLLFSLIILVCFIVSIRSILHQRQLSDMKNAFINNMTHEFKTPIATISLATDALQNPIVQQQPNRVTQYLGIIKEENQRMLQQVERVLQLARMEGKQLVLKSEPIELNEWLQDVAAHFQLQVEHRAGRLSLQVPALSPTLSADPVLLTNALHNVIDNAIKYSPDDLHIEVQCLTHPNEIEIRVKDKGIGMNPSEVARIFDRFYRVPTGDLHNVKGFGLGLSYTQQIIEAHQGRIEVQSRTGQGSEFRIFLPHTPIA